MGDVHKRDSTACPNCGEHVEPGIIECPSCGQAQKQQSELATNTMLGFTVVLLLGIPLVVALSVAISFLIICSSAGGPRIYP